MSVSVLGNGVLGTYHAAELFTECN